MHMTPALGLHDTVKMLLADDPSAWERGYYDCLLRRSVAGQPAFPLLDFEYERRDLLYRLVNEKTTGDGPVDFLEFGVFNGDSFAQWLRLNAHPESRFYGFDSFEGLPEDWEAAGKKKGDFDAQGRLPRINDPRARFVKGWFDQTLPAFLKTWTPRNPVIAHLDADLYSSTLCVLMQLDAHLAPGSALVFDEFAGVDEFAAFHSYARCRGRRWRFLAARRDFVKVAVALDAPGC